MSRFLDALHSGRVLLMDGAMGTELQKVGLGDGECGELWNLNHPERVRAIHQAYVDAGAEVLLTNTFQANPQSFPDFWSNTATAMRSARDTAGKERFVFFDIGPFEVGLRHWGAASALHVAAPGPVDGLLVETCSKISDVATLVKFRSRMGMTRTGLPILFSWTFRRTEDGTLGTIHGDTPERCAAVASRYAIAALGVNCGRDIGLDDLIEIVRRYRSMTDLPLFVRPNAGTPMRDGKRWVYPLTPEAMAARLPELLEAGVRMIGGCCGTTPEHIAACKPIVDAWNARRVS